MKNKFRKLVSVLVVTALMITVLCGCPANPKDPIIDPTKDPHEGVLARAEELKDHESLPDIEVTQKLKWMSWYGIDESQPAAELFKLKYGIPESEESDKIIEIENVNYPDRYPKLSAAISSGTSPDLFQFEERNFPWGAHAGQYEKVDDLFDFSGAEWDNTRDAMELFKWRGDTYCAITEIANSTALLFYRKSIAAEAGLEDPYDLWMKNEWTWDTFEEMCKKFSDPQNNKYPIMGFYIDESTILSTGTGIVSIENGLLKNNMNDARIERAMDLLNRLATQNLRFPYHELTNFDVIPTPFRNGEVLFWNDGRWKNEEDIKTIRLKDKWPEDELCIVPYPRDPEAIEYYHRGKQDALMLVAGSQNKEGFQAWTQCAVLANQDPTMRAMNREKLKRDHEWTDFQLDTLDKIRDETTLVWDFKNGIGEDVSGATFDSPVEQLSKFVVINGESYTQMRGMNEGVIKLRISEINAGKTDITKYVPPEPEEGGEGGEGGEETTAE